MDFNQLPLGFGLAYMADRMALDHATNMSDDEKREYVERHRDGMSDSELDRITASLGEDDASSVFRGPGIG